MSTTYPNAIRIADMPDLGEVTDATSLVGERAGSGRFSAPALRSYLLEAPMSGAIGRNLLHNSMFQIAQRGAGPFTVSAYTLDRWASAFSADTVSVAQQPLADIFRAQIGDEEAEFALANTFTGNAGAGAYNFIFQRIENVRRLAGKTVTVSFWAICAAGTLKLGVNLYQNFGTGGSPSTGFFLPGQSVDISTSFARHSLTFTLPSASGKTLGTNDNDNTELNFWYSCGATNAALSGNVGVQSGTVWIWGVQLEIGTTATILEKPDPRFDLSNCQRFYQVCYFSFGSSAAVGGSGATLMLPFTVPLRATPTIVPGYTTQANCGSSTVTPQTWFGYHIYTVVTGAGNWAIEGSLTASAEL
jgi:hypothetical protein